jgi:hypothetical protein
VDARQSFPALAARNAHEVPGVRLEPRIHFFHATNGIDSQEGGMSCPQRIGREIRLLFRGSTNEVEDSPMAKKRKQTSRGRKQDRARVAGGQK